jgi:ribonuclease P protein component
MDVDPTQRPRRSRLTRSGDFDAVYRKGKSASNRHLVVYAFRRDGASPDGDTRLGVSVSKKVGGAVERNRIKRVLREQFVQFAGDLPDGMDFVAIAKVGTFEYLQEHGSAALGARLGELLGKVAGLAPAGA